MTYVVVLASISTMLLVGGAMISLARPRLKLRTTLEWLPILFATGSIVVANWGIAQVVTLRVIHPGWLVVSAGAILLSRVGVRRPHWRNTIPLDGWHFLAAGLGTYAVLRVGVLQLASMDHDMGWDGLFYWGLKAKMLLMPEIHYFTDHWLEYTHPDYPLLLPSLEAWTYHWAGSIDLRAVKWITPFCLATSALLVYLGLRRFRGPASSALFALTALLTGPGAYHSTVSFADLVVGAFFVGAVVYGAQYVRTLDQSCLFPSALFIAAGMLTKKEGGLLALALLCALALSLLPHKISYVLRALRTWGTVALLSYGPWLAFALLVRPLSYDFVGITRGTCLQALHRVPEIAARLKGELMSVERWGPTWASVLVALIVFPDRWRRPEVVFVSVCVLMPLALYAASYGFSIWPSVTNHMDSSLDRLFLHLAPAVLFAAGTVSAGSGRKSAL